MNDNSNKLSDLLKAIQGDVSDSFAESTLIDEHKVIVVDEKDKKTPGGVLILDSDIISFKSDNPSLEHPFFALNNKRHHGNSIRYYTHNDVEIKLTASQEYGFATIHDKDVWIYCMSKILQGSTDGVFCQTVQFTVYDFLKQTNRSVGGRSYDLFLMALRRLNGTVIETNIETNGKRERSGFSLILEWDIIESDDKKMSAVKVTLPKWLIRALISRKEILTISKDYFDLSPTERRLYEIARKHCGNNESFKINLELLRKKVGANAIIHTFKNSIKKIIEKQSLPRYKMEFCEREESIIFTQK